MKKEIHTAYEGLKIITEVVEKLKKSKPELFTKSGIRELPGFLYEYIKKSKPKMTNEMRSFIHYFTGNMNDYVSGDYSGADDDKEKKKAADAAYEGLKTFETAAAGLFVKNPEAFSEDVANNLPDKIGEYMKLTGIKPDKYGQVFLEQFIGFVGFCLKKGFKEYDPKDEGKPKQMSLF
ncbi:MAG: hypothetical protein LLG37_05670 [Spirochaetia bacterium]|nr:hypothetical protein [Spirochaetia bacterium]